MGRPRSFDEAAAVAQAATLFAERGYEGTSIDDLVQALGIHRGSLYSTFGSKRALYLRVLEEHVATLGAHTTGDLTLLLRAAVERAPVDADAAGLVAAGFAALERRLDGSAPGDRPDTLAQLLGEHLIRRATVPVPFVEEA
jgi:TetR/AcrR family transcriptional regulator, transcriptional repressor for nem operon